MLVMPLADQSLTQTVCLGFLSSLMKMSVASGLPVSVRTHGTLPPDSTSRYYRIYVDVTPGGD